MPTGKISKHYMYEYFRETSTHVKQNLVVGVHFILHGNRSILSYKETPLDQFMMYKIQKIEPIKGVSPEYTRPITFHEENQFYAAKLSTIDSRLIQGLSLLNVRIWGYPVNQELIAAILQKKPKQFNITYYRDRYSLFNMLKNEVMDLLNCVYVFHAHVHLTQILALFDLMIVSPDENKKYFSSNVDLAFKYFDITLKTMATVYNENYVPAG
ncbi:Hypothetical protein CINCED_3A019585 [Cinara cedri]|uniref:Uncharacterized protein n=1 Tax=Cinara cedri TaxID=506608 RepID=A0A5E4MQX5_9HEMI|nr:Hypothetical protein CINCED_3A019585 [Cinara cedri]